MDAIPSILTVRRWDNDKTLKVAVAELRWYYPLSSVKYALARIEPHAGDVAYLRESPDSPWCVRVDVLPESFPLPDNLVAFPSLEARS